MWVRPNWVGLNLGYSGRGRSDQVMLASVALD